MDPSERDKIIWAVNDLVDKHSLHDVWTSADTKELVDYIAKDFDGAKYELWDIIKQLAPGAYKNKVHELAHAVLCAVSDTVDEMHEKAKNRRKRYEDKNKQP